MITETKMDAYRACGLIEGFVFTDNEDEILQAWSYIGKTGLYRQLQGFYSRTLKDLIDNNYLDTNFDIV